MNVILISAGNFQEYIVHNIDQLLKLNYKVHIITDKKFDSKLEKFKNKIIIYHCENLSTDFDKKSKLDKKFRGGFWNLASKRLFLLYEYMKKQNIENVIHLENDVLLYSKMNFLFDKSKIYLTMDSQKRCIPGIVFIPNYKLLTNLINNYEFTKDDMKNMGIFYKNNRNICKTFPIINGNTDIFNENFKEFNSIFDAAAMGQYLGGVDPNNKLNDTSGFINETCVIKYNKYKFKWIKKGSYYFPYILINKNLIPINNLHIHSKRLHQFKIDNPLTNSYINKEIDFISGEKIQLELKTYVGKENDYKFNPNISKANKKTKLILGKIKDNINNKNLIFCYTHLLDNIDIFIKDLRKMKNKFSLVFHNSDGNFEKSHLKLFNKVSKLKRIYTQNINVKDPRVIPLPIGIGNSQWPHGNISIFKRVYNQNIPKTKNIFFNFSINTNKKIRQDCYDKILKKNIEWNKNKPFEDYLKELKAHKYCICPEGNGIDAHRFWECLYMDVIPICKRNILVEYYRKFFPIVILDDWSDLDLIFLEKEYNNFIIDHKYLDFQYIKSIIFS